MKQGNSEPSNHHAMFASSIRARLVITNWYNCSQRWTIPWIDNPNHRTSYSAALTTFSSHLDPSALCTNSLMFLFAIHNCLVVFWGEIICTDHSFENIFSQLHLISVWVFSVGRSAISLRRYFCRKPIKYYLYSLILNGQGLLYWRTDETAFCNKNICISIYIFNNLVYPR